MAEEIFWRCPVCGFKAHTPEEQDQHMQQTGHLTHNDVEDKGEETLREPSDLEFTKHTGYTPGVSDSDVVEENTDEENREEILGEKPNKK